MITFPGGHIFLPLTGNNGCIGLTDADSMTLKNSKGKTAKNISGSKAEYACVFNNKRSATTVLEDNGNILALRQSVEAGDGKGISGVSFTIRVPLDEIDVLIPAWGGIKLSKSSPDIMMGFTRLEYPFMWSAQMLMLQGRDGGILVYAADNGTQFKALTVTHDDAFFNIVIQTVPQAPFRDYERFDTLEWRFVPYTGGWPAGAAIYKDYADAVYGLPEIETNKPGWAKEIQLVVLADLVGKFDVDELAKRVDPSMTLIEIPGWRVAAYDTKYPDYTPKPYQKGMIQYAQELGFRISVHFNFIGVDYDSPEYEILKSFESLDAYTLEPIVEKYTAYGREFRFSQINPASSEWRRILIDKAVQTVETLGVDAIHLDQDLICFNDGRGLVDGMTSLQGNVLLHKELAEALPGIAFSGEGINEINARYSSWLQQHVYGLDSGKRAWDENEFDQILPFLTAIFGGYTRLWQYPAFPVASDKPPESEYFNAWWRAGVNRMGLIPTLMRESPSSYRYPGETLRNALEVAVWYQKNQPRISLDPLDWTEGVALALKYGDNKTAVYKKDGAGEIFIPDVS